VLSEASVAKIGWGRKKAGSDFSLGSNLEEALHESHLSANVAFPDSFNLSLPDHICDLIPADGSPRRLETEEAESRIDSAFCRVGRQRVVLADTFLSAPLRTMRDRFRVTSLSSDLCR
jgi:hypothetical protein